MRGEARAGTSIHVPAPSPKLPGSITRGSHQPLPGGSGRKQRRGEKGGHCGAKLKVIRATSRVTRAPGAEIIDLEASANSLCWAPPRFSRGSQCLLCRRLISHMAPINPGKGSESKPESVEGQPASQMSGWVLATSP